jgi:hypothetical protein
VGERLVMDEPRERRPDDLQVSYDWVAGSMPPPHHHEYTIVIGPGCEGSILFRPDYSGLDAPLWTESFVVTEDGLDELYQLMAERGVFTTRWAEVSDGAVGGSLEWLRCTAGAEQWSIPARIEESDRVGEVYSAVRALVPDAVWKGLRERREQYMRDYTEPE